MLSLVDGVRTDNDGSGSGPGLGPRLGLGLGVGLRGGLGDGRGSGLGLGAQRGGGVFIVATSSRPNAIDPAMRRPGDTG